MSVAHNHIIIPDEIVRHNDYVSVKQGRDSSIVPDRDRDTHAQNLLCKLNDIRNLNNGIIGQREALSLPTHRGTYLEFSSSAGFDLISKSLEDIRQGVRLLNVRTEIVNDETVRTKALVYVPNNKEGFFLKKVEDYATRLNSRSGNPVNQRLVNSIEDVELAMLESFWPFSERHLIPNAISKWCEVWLRITDGDAACVDEQVRRFLSLLDGLNISRKENAIMFPERAVILINANREALINLFKSSEQIAEYRIGQEVACFWTNERNIEQVDWVQDLLNRLEIEESNVRVCILDTGVNNGHDLISPILEDNNCMTINPLWGTHDQAECAPRGHGTLMAGLVGYGNLQHALEARDNIIVTHKLCSVKILPTVGASPKEHWGANTEDAIYRAEARNPDQALLYCMAVTSSDDVDRGKPSSWSGTIDRICYGDIDNKRLFIVSGGNVAPCYYVNYPESNKVFSVQNPAQSWNALSVGAHTEKHHINDARYDHVRRIAVPGQISPYNSTSFTWGKKWPIKPEVLFEGGNLFLETASDASGHEDLELLSTSREFARKQFDTIWGTSAAVAQASWLAGKISAKYPQCWPETTRGLIVHSAQWTEQMIAQFPDIGERLRCCGYGICDSDRALSSYENGLTYIGQSYIQPFIKAEGAFKTKDMDFYVLPWPRELLLSMGDIPVKLRVTLSYFIEPSPGEIGWKNKYTYQSFGLRFDLNRVGESEEAFKQRINRLARDDEYDNDNAYSNQNWIIGSQRRSSGSIHTDIWEGTAADIADCNKFAVFPVIGWWRERHHLHRYNSRCRYSLIISMDTPSEEVELYSTVQAMIQVPVEVTIP